MAGNQRTADVIVDDRAFKAGLATSINQLRLETEADLQRLGMRAVRSMRQFCPVDFGNLRNSIGMTIGRDGRGMYVDVGPTLDYGPPVEYGTRYAPAQPFVRPGLAEAVAAGLR